MANKYTRIIQYPFATSLQGALLDSYTKERRHGQVQIALNFRALEFSTKPQLFERKGVVHEHFEGKYIPANVTFSGVSKLTGQDFFTKMTDLPESDPIRTAEDMLSWQQPKRNDIFFILGMHAPNTDSLMFFAHRVAYERFPQLSTRIVIERDWSPSPPMPQRLVPRPKQLYGTFGGDPITIRANNKIVHRKLFIGELAIQPKHRPQVDAVLNLGEEPSKWVKGKSLHVNDRAVNKGEGLHGMSLAEIQEESKWVIERLRRNQRVLVHCVAGMNRSTTICCAVLIMMENIKADEALARVREHHPWAKPDSRHWLMLRWLEKNQEE